MSRSDRHAYRLLALAGAVIVLAAGTAVSTARAGGITALAASGPSMTSTPSSELVNGQFVKLAFTGLPPQIGLAFRECIAGATTVATDCTATSSTGGVTDANGNGQNYLQVSGGVLPAAGSTTAAPMNITCDSKHDCDIVAVQDNTDLNGAVFTPVAFAPAPDNCPQASNDILGVGSSSAYDAIYRWEAAECLPPGNVKVGYTGGAIDDYVQPFFSGVSRPAPSTIAFAVTGPQPVQATPPSGSSLTFRYAPLTSSGVVLAYLMYDGTGAQVTSLTLTPDLIAQIVLGEIPNWNTDSQILALNPNVQHFPSRILSFYRAESSSMTYVETSWLAANAPSSWSYTTSGSAPSTVPLGASLIFPSDHSGPFATGVTGADNLGLKVAQYAPLDELDQGSVGFMDSSTAAYYGLPTVQIQRPDGSVVAATSATLSQAIADDTLNRDGTLAINYANSDPAAYPLAMPTYMLVPTNTLDPAEGKELQGFLRYAVQAGQENEPAGYAPLPANLVNVSLEASSRIPAQAAAPASSSSSSPGASTPVTPAYRPLALLRPMLHAPLLPPHTAVSTGTCAKTTKASKSPCASTHTIVIQPPSGQRFSAEGDSTGARLVVPTVAGAAAVLILVGGALWLVGVRDRPRWFPRWL